MIDVKRRHEAVLPLAELYSPIQEDLAAATRIFDQEIASELSLVNGLCDTVRSYRGKMLRPALLLLSARATGEVVPAHHTLAAVIEMVHVATLVHDDVLDEADERRRKPTISSLTGNVAAVLLGDYLISHAFHLSSGLSSRHASRRIGATTNLVCEGEMLQNHLRGDTDLSEEQYFDIIRRKTGALTALSGELGAFYARAEEPVVSALRSYGMAVGVAFQIIDDVLDIVGNRAEVGKTLGRDLSLGKPTLPMIHCLSQASAPTISALTAALVDETPCERERLQDWLAETGSIDYAVTVATRQVEYAVDRLEPLAPSLAKDSLVGLAEFIIRRCF